MNKKKAYVVSTAHLDTVWRWRLATTIKEYIPDTIRKNFDLIEKYPNYRFNFEGAYRYEIIEKAYPHAFDMIKKYAADDRWCISGTAYENGDANIPSPEALIRNILIGDRYFKKHFGKSSKDIFLPDCFGFGWALPSVAAHCGLLGFTTQKLSWGSANGLPFDLGRWTGPDGKGIFACLNAKSYRYKFTGDIRADLSIIDKVADNANHAGLPWANHLYGTGDWGGSPTEESVIAVEESIKKNDLSDFEVISAHSDDVFKDMDKLSDEDKAKLPLWNSDLLMTSHGAGAYTSRCMSKKLNRQNEQFGLATEKSCVLAHSLGAYEYPKEALTQAWKRVAAHQFHDDITGTSWMQVYNESWNDYYLSLSQFKNEFLGSGKAIIEKLHTSWINSRSTAIMVNNPTQYKRKSVVEAVIRTTVNCKNIAVYDAEGNEVPSQLLGKNGKLLTIVFLAELKSFEYKMFEVMPSDDVCNIKTDVKATNHSLENSKYKIIFNKNGDIAYLYDKKLGRQIIDSPIKMALLHNTGSLAYPSWEIRKEDIDKEPFYYANTPEFSILENGPARVSIKIIRQLEKSQLVQIISLDSDGEYIKVNNYIDWRSRRCLLKAVFPTAAHNPNAAYDLGLGVIERGNNTDSQYEVPAQKWADITDKSGEYGISIFSDSKYGWDKPKDNTLRLSCIHTPAGAFTKETRQDLQDLGRNIFSFAIYSHKGGFENGTQMQSEIFANPVRAIQTSNRSKGTLGDSVSLASISNDAVMIRAIKMAEDDNSVIVRVNEANGKAHKNVELKLINKIKTAFEANGVEEEITKLKVQNGILRFDINPFEVKTFKLIYADETEYKPDSECTVHYLPFNAKGYTENNEEMRHVILQGAGLSLPAEIRPTHLTVGGIPFDFTNPNEDRYDVLICRGQTIPIKPDTTRIYFIAGSTLGNQKINIQVGNVLVPFYVRPITAPIASWDMAGLNQVADINPNEKLGFEFPYTHHPEGINPDKAIFYLYTANVKDVESIVLPENNRVVILAMTECNESSKSALATKIEDTACKDYSFDDDLPPIDKIIDKSEFVTIRAGKIQDQVNSGKGKGLKRDNIITNIIRSYTKSEW